MAGGTMADVARDLVSLLQEIYGHLVYGHQGLVACGHDVVVCGHGVVVCGGHQVRGW